MNIITIHICSNALQNAINCAKINHMAKSFSLATVLSLTDKFTAPMSKIEGKIAGFGKKMSRNFGAFGQSVKKVDAVINKAAIATGAFFAAGVAGSVALINQTATLADNFAKTARTIGITAEELQAFTYAANLQGVSTESLNSGLKIMMKNIGELKNGTGTLSKYIEKMDAGFLKTLKSTQSADDALLLLLEAINNTPDEFGKAALAQAAFGKGGLELIKLSNGGADAIKNMMEEAKKYGLISNQAAAASEKFKDEQNRLMAMLLGLKNQAFNAIIPKALELVETFRKGIEAGGGFEAIAEKIKNAIEKIDVKGIIDGFKSAGEKITAFIAIGKKVIDIIGILAPGFLTFVIAIKAVTLAIGIYKAVMIAAQLATLPTTVIIYAIIAAVSLLVIGIVQLYKNWDTVVQFFKAGVEVFKGVGNALMSFLLSPINAVIEAIGGMLRLMSKIPGVGNKLNPAIEKLDELQSKMNLTLTGSEKGFFAGGAQEIAANTKERAAQYINPATRTAETKTSTSTTTRNEVQLNAPSGYSFSSGGKAPVPSISFGVAQ